MRTILIVPLLPLLLAFPAMAEPLATSIDTEFTDPAPTYTPGDMLVTDPAQLPEVALEKPKNTKVTTTPKKPAVKKKIVSKPEKSETPVGAEPAKPIDVTVGGLEPDGSIGKEYAQCIATKDGKSTKGENLRPAVSWTDGPAATLSYAIVVSDPDVPSDLTIANNDELLIADDFPRQTLYHWVQFNITPDVREVPGGTMPPGFGRAASNDVSSGNYKLGYGGPCPPWNDALRHRYHFTVHALDVKKLPLLEGAPAKDAVQLIEAHSIAKGEAIGTFTLNPALRKGKKL